MMANTVSGMAEVYYLPSPDLSNDANLAATCMAGTLQICVKELTRRKLDLPRNGRFHSDTAASEAKNITLMCLRVYLVWSGAFLSFDATEEKRLCPITAKLGLTSGARPCPSLWHLQLSPPLSLLQTTCV